METSRRLPRRRLSRRRSVVTVQPKFGSCPLPDLPEGAETASSSGLTPPQNTFTQWVKVFWGKLGRANPLVPKRLDAVKTALAFSQLPFLGSISLAKKGSGFATFLAFIPLKWDRFSLLPPRPVARCLCAFAPLCLLPVPYHLSPTKTSSAARIHPPPSTRSPS